MGASNCQELTFAKGKPHVLVKRAKKAERDSEDTRERKLCHVRSGGRCECREVIRTPEASLITTKRCKGKAVHNHHLISGVGKRNVGISILSDHRLDLCVRCHQDVEAGILEPTKKDDCYDAATVTYDRRMK